MSLSMELQRGLLSIYEGTVPDMDNDNLPEIIVGVPNYTGELFDEREREGAIFILSSSVLR